ncbi:MAG: hypothetical protein GDA50_00900, partial [Alphaproteobacteria bacterium GM202ARS2]|nr:hypothetical protein [Alphaproteobacteria bacterium GM202ARS2]
MITLFYAYARSGGTLLNRILAAMPDNVVMSEVLPTNHTGATIYGVQSGSVWHQALYWYDIRLKNKDYIAAILELADICQRSGRHLIIREWCTGCYFWYQDAFLPGHNIPLPHKLFTLNHLPQDRTRPFALVRHGADSWKSLTPNDSQWCDETARYAQSYLAYAQDLHKSQMPIYHYAELCRRPYPFVQKLCHDLAIPFDKRGVARFHHIITACGDTGYRGRYAKSTTIRPLVRRVLRRLKQENLFRSNADFREADRLLGLVPDKPLNTLTHALKTKAKKHTKKDLAPLLPSQELNKTTPLWSHRDIISPSPNPAPLLSKSTLRHVATIPPGHVVVVLYASTLDSGVVQTLQALDDAPSDFPPRAFIVMTHRERG